MTEKNYNPKQKERKAMKKQEKISKQKNAIEVSKKEKKLIKEEQKEKPEAEVKTEAESKTEVKEETKTETEKKETEETPKKQPETAKTVVKKTEAVAKAKNLDLSTKKSAAICKFIKGKNIEKAIEDLKSVLEQKKAVPIKGEVPHKKGRIMSGIYPKKAAENFIKILKNLSANANANNLENPVIIEAVANIGSRPYGRFGKFRKKRTHVLIKVKEMKK